MKKITLIIGGSSDIAIATCKLFLEKKHIVLLNIRQSKSKNTIIKNIDKKYKLNEDFFIYTCDISNINKTNLMFRSIIKKFSIIDCLVNNAAITDVSKNSYIDNYRKIFDTNFFGILNCINNFLKPITIKKRYIVNISSEVSNKGSKNLPAYASSKAALDNFTKSSSSLLIKKNVYINTILPSLVLTSKIKKTKNIRDLSNKIPIKRLANPDEIAELIYFLCSKNSSYISGSFIDINGGNRF